MQESIAKMFGRVGVWSVRMCLGGVGALQVLASLSAMSSVLGKGIDFPAFGGVRARANGVMDPPSRSIRHIVYTNHGQFQARALPGSKFQEQETELHPSRL
jgi:hypothetical protein